MNPQEVKPLKPFLSILFLISTLIALVFVKMEERRLSYVVLKLTKEFKKINEVKKQKEIALAKLTRPQLLENVATKKLTLKRISQSQIIHLTDLREIETAPQHAAPVALSHFFESDAKVRP